MTTEPYDLVVAPGMLDDPLLTPLWALLRSPAFRSAVEGLGGYSTAQMGVRIR